MAQDNAKTETVFNLEKIYVKDISYEAPNVPHVFLEKQAPEVGIQLGLEHTALNTDNGLHEVVLSITATAKLKDKTVFLIEVKQAGIFRLQGLPVADEAKVLEITCPNILLPFAREAVNDLAGKGGFPQLLISPINFEALHQQKQAAEQQGAH
jgi:preprotein translocase subunit SecB